MWVNLTDDRASSELLVALYPTSIGTVGPWVAVPDGQQLSGQVIFTNIIVAVSVYP
jgi:hypothetical protein